MMKSRDLLHDDFDDTMTSAVDEVDEGTAALNTIIEQKRQVADIYSAIRQLRSGIIEQRVGGYSGNFTSNQITQSTIAFPV